MSSQSERRAMYRITQENKKMQRAIDMYMDEIEGLKHTNRQHQGEIESLLKFNERLLSIIQEEVTNQNKNPMARSLHPISQVTEVDSQAMEQMMLSLYKTKHKLAAKSQIGNNYQNVQYRNSKMEPKMFEVVHKDLQRSERYHKGSQRNYSQVNDHKSSFSKKKEKKQSNDNFMFTRSMTQNTNKVHKPSQQYVKLDKEMTQIISREMQDFRQKSKQNHEFLDSKIDQLKNLSSKIQYHPMDKFNQISSKLGLKGNTATLVRNAMLKNMI